MKILLIYEAESDHCDKLVEILNYDYGNLGYIHTGAVLDIVVFLCVNFS